MIYVGCTREKACWTKCGDIDHTEVTNLCVTSEFLVAGQLGPVACGENFSYRTFDNFAELFNSCAALYAIR